MSIEQRFDVPFIARMSFREKQIQQNYRPIIGVHKWFARRPGTLFRGLLLSEFGEGCLQQEFFRSHSFPGVKIADPFMGGGTPLIEANRVGCDVEGFDINPMSAWIVREALGRLDLNVYRKAADELMAALRAEVGGYHRTTCPLYGDDDVPVKSFLWIKTRNCEACDQLFDLFPGYLLAENRRHPKHVLVCPECGELNEADNRECPGDCAACGTTLRQRGPARRGRCDCPHCGHVNAYPGETDNPPEHRLFVIEYYNPQRKIGHKGRFFKKPDAEDLARAGSATERWRRMVARFAPDASIPAGDETARLHRWGYSRYREMFNPRQLLGLELSCRLVAGTEDERTGERINGGRRRIAIHCADAAGAELTALSLDAVFTDPPYFGNVQYAELMDFCYVWLRRLADKDSDGFERRSTRSSADLTGNVTESRGLEHFTEGLSKVYSRMARALKPGAPLVFTYHHNKLDAYCAVGTAILDAGLVCSASLPCPAEMGGSIHIHGARSSIIDTIFVCRNTGETSEQWLFDSSDRLIELVSEDLAKLMAAGRRATRGDTRCIVFGHLTRMAAWNLRTAWDRSLSTSRKIAAFRCRMADFGDPEAIARSAAVPDWQGDLPLFAPAVSPGTETRGAVSF